MMDDGDDVPPAVPMADVSTSHATDDDAEAFSSSDYSSAADDDDTSGFIADGDDDEVPRLVEISDTGNDSETPSAAVASVVGKAPIDADDLAHVETTPGDSGNSGQQVSIVDDHVRRFDLVLFGASGWVGRQALIRLIKSYCPLASPAAGDCRGHCANCKEQCSSSSSLRASGDNQLSTTDVTFAVAGRDKDALLDAIEDSFEFLGRGPQGIEMMIAEADDEEAVRRIARRAKIFINCVGPYFKYGETAIRVCIEEGTHYLDLCCESKFIEQMEEKYGAAAENKGVFIVNSCGFDSIPTDVGVAELQKNFHGELLRIEQYVRPIISGDGYCGSLASWESAVDEMSRYTTSEVLHSILPTEAPYLAPRSTDTDDAKIEGCYEKFPHLKRDIGVGWPVPVYLPSRSSVVRSWEYFDDQLRASGDASKVELETVGGLASRPCPVKTYFVFSSFFRAAFAIMWAIFLFLFTRFQWSTDWLKSHPRIAGCGMFWEEGASAKQREKAKFEQAFIGYGWTRRDVRRAVTGRGVSVSAAGDNKQSQNFCDGMPNKVEVLRIQGPDPNYVTSAICLTQCAVTLLKERDRMSKKTGVLPPGVVFRNTQLTNRLRSHGIAITMDT